jgi:putative Mn2+ efflux pump MntP
MAGLAKTVPVVSGTEAGSQESLWRSRTYNARILGSKLPERAGACSAMFGGTASTLLLGLASNYDNLTVGAAYGAKNRRVPLDQNLLIAVVTTTVTLGAMELGGYIREILPLWVPDNLGGTLLIVFAAWSFYRERANSSDWLPADICRFTKSTSVGINESAFLAAALSINNMGLAIAGGIGGGRQIWMASSVFCFSVAMLALGQALGRNFIQVRSAPRVFCRPASGNAMLALAGVIMLSGY